MFTACVCMDALRRISLLRASPCFAACMSVFPAAQHAVSFLSVPKLIPTLQPVPAAHPVPEPQPLQERVLAVGGAGPTGDKAVPATAKGTQQQVGPDTCALQLVM